MTANEKFAMEHPNKREGTCPHHYGYLPKPAECGHGFTCRDCWDREIPEVFPNRIDQGIEAGFEIRHFSGPKPWDEMVKDMTAPRILDSGARQEFGTGAVRDIQEGKGRCDLMPLDVVSFVYAGHENLGDDDSTYAWVFYLISRFQATGEINYLREAIERSGIFAYRETMFLEVAIHFEEGAKKYGENNWQKGIPVKRYIDSAVRHYLKFLRGDKDEPHDRAFCWNIMCAIWTCKHKPELNDYHDIDRSIAAAEHVIKACDDALKRMEEKPLPRFYAEDNE